MGYDLPWMTHRAWPRVFGGAKAHDAHHVQGDRHFHQFFHSSRPWARAAAYSCLDTAFESTGALAGFLGPTTAAPLRLVCISPDDSVQSCHTRRAFQRASQIEIPSVREPWTRTARTRRSRQLMSSQHRYSSPPTRRMSLRSSTAPLSSSGANKPSTPATPQPRRAPRCDPHSARAMPPTVMRSRRAAAASMSAASTPRFLHLMTTRASSHQTALNLPRSSACGRLRPPTSRDWLRPP